MPRRYCGQMFLLVWFGGPFLLATILAAVLAKSWLRAYLLFALGLLIGFGFVLAAYLRAPTHFNGCEDCEQSFGRWWEPNFIIILAGVGYFFWMLGIGLGAFLNVLARSARSGDA